MSDNGRLSLIFTFTVLAYLAIGEINTMVSGLAVYLHLDALLLVFFGLYLNRLSGLVYTAILGFLVEALYPVPTGLYLIGYLAIWLFFTWCQRRIRRQNRYHVRGVVVAIQVIWMLLLAIVLGSGSISNPAYWQRILVEIGLSALAVYLLTWPWCQFQKKLLYSLGWDLEAQVSHM
jgi:cell shape-determining protein MreD